MKVGNYLCKYITTHLIYVDFVHPEFDSFYSTCTHIEKILPPLSLMSHETKLKTRLYSSNYRLRHLRLGDDVRE